MKWSLEVPEDFVLRRAALAAEEGADALDNAEEDGLLPRGDF